MSKYTDDKHEHERINKNCKAYRAAHRAEYNAKIRAYRAAKIAAMDADELAAYRAMRAAQQARHRNRKKKEGNSNER